MRFSMITLGGLLLAAATPAMAQDEAPAPEPAIKVTGNVTVTSDYRFRGISQTDKDPALQGTLNINHESGFYAGIFASTIDDKAPAVLGYGDAEIDLYAGYTKTFENGVGIDVGLLYYLYPIDEAKGLPTDFFEPYASVIYTVGPVTAKVGANYAWGGQSGLFDEDSLYLRGDVTVAVPNTPVSLLGHIGRTDGQLGFLATPALLPADYLDWSLGVEVAHKFVKLGVQYVDTDIPGTPIPVLGKFDKLVGASPTVLAYMTLSF
jgi:uncharacterized protein (TIGR02001 family)